MKKVLSILFAIMLLFSMAGCSQEKEQKIALTTNNLKDYISFSVTITDCSTVYSPSRRLTCNANIKTFSTKKCSFENVQIKITISCGLLWTSSSPTLNTLTLSSTGEGQTTKSFRAIYESTNNYLSSNQIRINISNVSGYVIL